MITLKTDERTVRFLQEASKHIGTVEVGGDNKGATVEAFQKAVDGVAAAESWCMAFVQYCLKAVGGSILFKSEHCLTVWEKSPIACRTMNPKPGAIVIWRMKGTNSGHTGIVKSVVGTLMLTVEGNTGPGPGIERNGDGVYEKSRNVRPLGGTMELVGYLWPWRDGK